MRRTAQDLLAQIRLEKNADIDIISERYLDGAGTGWYHNPKMPEDLEIPPFIEAELRRAAGTL